MNPHQLDTIIKAAKKFYREHPEAHELARQYAEERRKAAEEREKVEQ